MIDLCYKIALKVSPMNVTSFSESLSQPEPPKELSVYQLAMWYAGKDEWDRAHELVQDLPDQVAAHIHAYLHRVEGDIWNADYWYSRANRSRPNEPLDKEWLSIVHLLFR